MKISTILDHIDNGHIALPEFQRGYVWNREQVRGLFDSMYKKHPVGGLLVWATDSHLADFRGDGQLASGIVKLLLDGQQRITTLYGVVRGKPPKFFDGNEQAFTGLMFHLRDEVFEFYQPIKMKDDPLWIDVSKLLKGGHAVLGSLMTSLSTSLKPEDFSNEYFGRFSKLLSILDIDLHIEEVTGTDKTIEVVVDIFNKVNSGGTKLSKGDLALAKICANWPEARDTMKIKLNEWSNRGFNFNLDWLLRTLNTTLTGEAKFSFLDGKTAEEIQIALKKATKHIEYSLNMIDGRLGLDHDRVLFGRFAIPVMARYLDKKGADLTEKERDKLLFWFLQAGMWGRYSGSTESFIDKDLEAIDGQDGSLDNLIQVLKIWRGGSLRIEKEDFNGWSLGARFYPVLYMLTRMRNSIDFGTGLPLKASLLGKMSKLEVHHLFPKAQLYNHNYTRSDVNALGNFSFLTKDTNISISDKLPKHYFSEVESKYPGALASHWIPSDEKLWEVVNYKDFLEARKILLAKEANTRLTELMHGNEAWMDGAAMVRVDAPPLGGIVSEDEEKLLLELNQWVIGNGYPAGLIAYELVDEVTGTQKAILDIAWPFGLQIGLSEPIALLLDETNEVHDIAAQANFKCFTSIDSFKKYFAKELAIGQL